MNHQIHVGQWRFFPLIMIAQNIHNGALAKFTPTTNGGWLVQCANCPAEWMFNELNKWFVNWIKGDTRK